MHSVLSHIALVRALSRSSSRAAQTVPSSLPGDQAISGGTPSSNQKVLIKREALSFFFAPLFKILKLGRSYAEMSKEQKNVISHRYLALVKLRVYLATLNAENNF